MARDCGWVEIMPEGERTVVARGRALLSLIDVPGAGDTRDWDGELNPLRLAEGQQSLPANRYVIRFEDSGEERLVELEPRDVAAGTRSSATVRGADGELPSALSDRLGASSRPPRPSHRH